MFNYPWGDMHSLNLGWFLMQFKAWVDKIQEYLDNGGGTDENLANVIAPVFNAANSYLTGDYVLYNDELYKALEPVTPGTWNPDAWERCLVTEEMGSSASGVDNVARLMIAGQYSNTYNYQKYAICRYSDRLWMCNTNLPSGGEEWTPSHWDEITVGAGLTGLRRSVDTLSGLINNLSEAINELNTDDITNESGVTGTTLTNALNTLIGALTPTEITAVVIEEENTTLNAKNVYKVGRIALIYFNFQTTTSLASNTNIFSGVPGAIATWSFIGDWAEQNQQSGFYVTSGGYIRNSGTLAAGHWHLVGAYVTTN